MAHPGLGAAVVGAGVVRVIDGAGQLRGAGFLVGPDLVATCDHVLAAATGAGPVRVDFPLTGAAPVAVEVLRRLPIAADGSGDVALLRLLSPAPARMPPVRRLDDLWDRRFGVLGFPESAPDGVWSTGRIRGRQGTGWCQLQGHPADEPIEAGFSGSPVWDLDSGAVIGMTVAADVSGVTTTAYLIPVEQVLGLDPELLPCPYRGLEAFDEEHAAVFFGRGDDADRLAAAVTGSRLVAVTGPSGVGKSSLVLAGLLPRLRAAGLRPELRRSGRWTVPAPDGPGERVVVVDQVEEMLAADPARTHALLDGLVTGGDRLVLSMRSATLDELLARIALPGLVTVPVAPMTRARLREAVTGPAERAPGLAFEPGVVERLLDDAAVETGSLPLVEVVLTELWHGRDGGVLRLAAYERLGGVAGVVATRGEAVAGTLDTADTARLRRLAGLLTDADADGRFLRRPVSLGAMEPELRPLVARLAAERLVVVAGEVVELAHAAVAVHWPRWRDWLIEDRAFLRWRRGLDERSARWTETGHDDGGLLRGAELVEAQQRLAGREGEVAAPGRELVRRSVARQHRDLRRWRVVAAVLTTLVVLAGVLAWVSTDRGVRLDQRLSQANADILGRAALERQDTVSGSWLALTAHRMDPANPSARDAVARLVPGLASTEAVFPDVSDRIAGGFTMSDDGGVVLVTEAAGLTVLRGPAVARTGEPLDRWAVPGSAADAPAVLAPDGRLLVQILPDGSVSIWDLVARSGPRLLPGPPVSGTAFNMTDDGRLLLWLTGPPGSRRLVVRDIATGAEVPNRLGPVTDPTVDRISLAPDRVRLYLESRAARGPTVARSLVNGAVLTTYPTDSRLARDGSSVVCTGGTVSVRSPDMSRELRRITVSACPRPDELLTQDLRYVADRPRRIRDYGTTTLTEVSSGARFQVVEPGIGDAVGSDGPVPLSTLAVVAGERPAVLLSQARGMLRLRALPALPPTRYQRGTAPVLIGQDLTGFTARDPVTGAALGRVSLPSSEVVFMTVADELAVVTARNGLLEYTGYALPGLTPTRRFPLGPAGDKNTRWVTVGPRSVVVRAEGRTTAFDRGSGAALGPGFVLGVDPAAQRFHAGQGDPIVIRPGHPDQVAVRGPGFTTEIWDLTQRRRTAVLRGSVPHSARVFDPSGERLVAVTATGGIEVWDVASATPARPPFPTPAFEPPIAVTRDGHVVLTAEVLGRTRLTFWDLGSGRPTGSVLMGSDEHHLGSSDGPSVETSSVGHRPPDPSLEDADWVARLCSVVDRPATPAEQAELPAGVEPGSPCT